MLMKLPRHLEKPWKLMSILGCKGSLSVSSISLGHINDKKNQDTQDVYKLLKLQCYNLHFQYYSCKKRTQGRTSCERGWTMGKKWIQS